MWEGSLSGHWPVALGRAAWLHATSSGSSWEGEEKAAGTMEAKCIWEARPDATKQSGEPLPIFSVFSPVSSCHRCTCSGFTKYRCSSSRTFHRDAA